jgi:hypothetical protein
VPTSVVRRRQRRSGHRPKPNPNSLVSPSLASLASRSVARFPRQPLTGHRSTSSRPAFSPPQYQRTRTAYRNQPPSPPIPPQGAGPAVHWPPQYLQPPSPVVSTPLMETNEQVVGSESLPPQAQALTSQQRERVQRSLVSPAALCPTPPAPASIRAATTLLSPSTTSPLDGTASLLFKIFSRPKRLSNA